MLRYVLKCPICGKEYTPHPLHVRCRECNSPLVPTISNIDIRYVLGLRIKDTNLGVWNFESLLVSNSFVKENYNRITMGEGVTPLLHVKNLGKMLGVDNVLIKDESRNPTGTFIDRGASTLITLVSNAGFRKVSVASLGDLGISVSAYARRAGMKVRVVMPHKVTPSKAYQTLLLADDVEFVSTYEEAISKVMKLRKSFPVTPLNPYLLDGYKTIYYEIFLSLKRHPDVLIVPIGDGALLTAIWFSIKELKGDVTIVGVKGCSSTVILKDISVEKPLYEPLIKDIVKESNGLVIDICEDDVLKATRILSLSEGILVEPVGASSIAALIKLTERNLISSKDIVIALITGGSLRDTAILRLLSNRQLISGDELRIGFTKSKILEALVIYGPLHSYAIWKIIREKYGIKVSLRVIYQHMEELEKLGLVKIHSYKRVSGRMRKIYEVTRKGMLYLR